jgi:hypothetical protein
MSVRSYTYIRAVVKRANAVSAVERIKRGEEAAAAFEREHAGELAEAWGIVEAAASRGCIRLFLREHPVFQKREIQLYFVGKGFSFSESTMEWWHEEKEKELR